MGGMKKWCCLLLALLTGLTCAAAEESAEMSLLAINVGKADCLLLRCGASAYLIDTGTKKTADRVLTVLEASGVTRLDGIILTHTHADHAGGLKALLAAPSLTVDAVYAPAFYLLKKEDGKHPIEKALKKADPVPVTWLRSGDTIPLDGGSLTVLGPIVPNEETENNNSLVLLAEGGGGTMLLTGDMEFPEEATLLQAGVLPKVDVLKIGNHGEGDATSEQFIQAVQPSLAVISTNTEEEPDTPDPRVIKLLDAWHVETVQTQDADSGLLITLRNGEISTEMQ